MHHRLEVVLQLRKSLSSFSDPIQVSSVRRYFMLSLASMRAVNTSRQRRAKVVQYVLFDWSSARSTFGSLRLSCSKMEFKFMALFFQKRSPRPGSGARPASAVTQGPASGPT